MKEGRKEGMTRGREPQAIILATKVPNKALGPSWSPKKTPHKALGLSEALTFLGPLIRP